MAQPESATLRPDPTLKTSFFHTRGALVISGAIVVLALVTTVFVLRARAASGTANLSVSANVTVNCTISTTAVAFGAYDAIGVNATTPLDAVGSVTIACTKGSTVTIGLGLGQNALASARRLAFTTDFLTYEMYLDTTRTTVWGTTGAGLLATGTAPSKAARSFTVYGRIPIAQDVPAGAFSDVVVATVNF